MKDLDFEQLFKTYYMQIYSYVMTLARDKNTAEEITQKAFFKAMTTSKKHQGNASEFTWLCAIAKNLYVDELRKYGTICELDVEAVSDTNLEHSLVNEDSAFLIHQVLHELEEPYKEVFQLRTFGELPFQKIGIIFKKSENWARVTYHRARLKIKERMERL